MQTYIEKSLRVFLTFALHLNGIWHLIWSWRYLSQPVLGGHPVLSGHYSIPRGCPLKTAFTVVWFGQTFLAPATRPASRTKAVSWELSQFYFEDSLDDAQEWPLKRKREKHKIFQDC